MVLILEAVANNDSKQQTKIQELDFIENGFWYDEAGEEKLRVLRYGMKKVKFRVYFTDLAFQYLTQYKLGMAINGKYYSSSEKEFKLAKKGNNNYVDHILSINGHIFANTNEPIVKLNCVLTLKSGKRTVLPYSFSDYCKVHFVIFIPQIMKHKGWNMSFKFQEYWFNEKANDNCEKRAFPNAVTITHILSYARVRKAYDRLYEVYKTENAQKTLIKQIQKMVNNKELVLPIKKGESVPFGNFNTFVFDDSDGSQKEKVPQYQYQFFTYNANLTRNPIKKSVNSNIIVWNKDYRNYRDDTGYGCDFNVYSTYTIHNLSFEIITNNL